MDHVVYCCETGRHSKASDKKHGQNARAARLEPAYSNKETSSSDDDSRIAQVADPTKSKPNRHSKKNRTSEQCTSTSSSICSNSVELKVAVPADTSHITARAPVWGHGIPNHGHQETMKGTMGDSKCQPKSEESTPLSCQEADAMIENMESQIS